MLAYLRIKNLAVVNDVSLELSPGLTVFTGETGAGKSIILGGLGLVLGERASLEKVRTGADRAVVEAAFAAPRDEELAAELAEAGLAAEDGSIVVRRVIPEAAPTSTINWSACRSSKQSATASSICTDNTTINRSSPFGRIATCSTVSPPPRPSATP